MNDLERAAAKMVQLQMKANATRAAADTAWKAYAEKPAGKQTAEEARDAWGKAKAADDEAWRDYNEALAEAAEEWALAGFPVPVPPHRHVAALTAEVARLRAALAGARRCDHAIAEYDDDEGMCNCGVDAHNARIEAALRGEGGFP